MAKVFDNLYGEIVDFSNLPLLSIKQFEHASRLIEELGAWIKKTKN